ncbi:peptidase [Pseudomaricurvus alkylphenolicus]|jgi:putative iron-regulated protein|uniref:imelysin family protein n=1 Tax=Pseudomaricurvus alkylphenolicus TaxID=1306991 RepID=UPI00141F8D0F|nr:imelysin family protein [Pseudomaricurvus alkylphenolicus]NIB39898.1 peptidase [Pseudomaricurvus alkylphenolicus]
MPAETTRKPWKAQANRLITAVVTAFCLTAGAHIHAGEREVVTHYADIAHATFEDSLIAAQQLEQKLLALTANPSDKTLQDARQAWKAARVPYQQSEVFRFGNAVVDDWEGQLNAWPLDEGLIDYVEQDSYESELGNVGANANIIANTQLQLGSEILDTGELTPELLASLNELGGSEANVATGYHAIEFLLWGQDLNGTGSGAGDRPHTDYAKGSNCTNGHCARRSAYLQATARLLVMDLEDMVQQWAPEGQDNYRQQLLQLPATEGLIRMLFGMGSLALGELAGERLKVALEANSPEDEHDCFSDNTHFSHYYNGMGIRNVYLGEYRRIDGTQVQGASLAGLVHARDAVLDGELRASLNRMHDSLQLLVDSAERNDHPLKFDQLIAEGNQEGTRMIEQAIATLVDSTRQLERAARVLGIDNLNPDSADHDF